jgi:hypothetical protein
MERHYTLPITHRIVINLVFDNPLSRTKVEQFCCCQNRYTDGFDECSCLDAYWTGCLTWFDMHSDMVVSFGPVYGLILPREGGVVNWNVSVIY